MARHGTPRARRQVIPAPRVPEKGWAGSAAPPGRIHRRRGWDARERGAAAAPAPHAHPVRRIHGGGQRRGASRLPEAAGAGKRRPASGSVRAQRVEGGGEAPALRGSWAPRPAAALAGAATALHVGGGD